MPPSVESLLKADLDATLPGGAAGQFPAPRSKFCSTFVAPASCPAAPRRAGLAASDRGRAKAWLDAAAAAGDGNRARCSQHAAQPPRATSEIDQNEGSARFCRESRSRIGDHFAHAQLPPPGEALVRVAAQEIAAGSAALQEERRITKN